MKKTLLALAFCAAITTGAEQAFAVPIACIACGSTVVTGGAGENGTLSFAVITGASFLTEGFPFVGMVPPGSLDALGPNVKPTDFVYLYQLVNTGQRNAASFQVDIGGTGPTLDAGGRLESTIFVQPGVGLVSLGPSGAIPGLSNGSPAVDFSVFNPGGACLGSGGNRNCSDGTTNLLASAVQSIGYDEAPSVPLLDPTWTSSILWFSTPLAPGMRNGSVFFEDGLAGSQLVPSPNSPAVPEPATLSLLASGLLGLGYSARRRRAT